MERTISIDLEQAKEWARGDNEVLKTLALKAFNKAELGLVTYKTCEVWAPYSTQKNIIMFNIMHKKLITVASYLNELFPPTDENRYFIYGVYDKLGEEYHNFGILSHKTVRYMGIIYFNTMEAAKIAIDILQEELFNFDFRYDYK